ncbi:MAG: FAD/NAD(P)-binding oxidoreductase, partial [Aquaticitalea sp.]
AEMLHTRKIPVTFLVREDNFWDAVLPIGESQMINRHIKNHGIDLRLKSNLKEIHSDENGRANAVVIEETGEVITCNLVGLTPGVSPNIDMIKTTEIETDKGVLVNSFLETNIENIYAIGDCAQQREPIGNRRPVEAVWYTGRMMGETVAQTICGNSIKYKPGHWFNSAKFFDIEYQTYGWVFAEPKEGNAHFHWKHEDDTKCITIEYKESSNEFLGINTFGIRMKHDIFDRWLTEKRSADYVMEHLKEANFDPEFYKSFETDILTNYWKQFKMV